MTELQHEVMDRPWRIVGIIAPGIAIGLVARLLAANGVADLSGTPVAVFTAMSCLLTGLGVCLVAGQRDRFDASLWWLAASTGLAFAAVAWISPPFVDDTRVWDNAQQAALAFVGLGIGVLIAGIIILAMSRRHPTATVALTLVAAVLVTATNTLALRSEWTGIVLLFVAFVLILVAWDRSPRKEPRFEVPDNPPRTSRAALTLAIFVLCGTGIQLWISRDGVPRGLPAVLVCAALIVTAFASMYRLRREFQNRETTLSEWTSWMREVRTKDFQGEIEGFAPTSPPVFDLPSHPELDTPSPAAVSPTAEPAAVPAPEQISPPPLPRVVAPAVGAAAAPKPASTFLSRVAEPEPPDLVTADATDLPALGGVGELQQWLFDDLPVPSPHRLFVAIESVPLEEHDALSVADQSRLRAVTADALRAAEPDAELVSWIDGPYFVLVYRSVRNDELSPLNKRLGSLLATALDDDTTLNGTLAMLRPSHEVGLDGLIDEAVIGLIQARQIEVATRRPAS